MKLVNIADEGAKYKWQLYDLYDKAFPEQEKKPLQVMENLVADGKMEMLAMVDEDEFVGLAINLIDAEQDRALLDYYAVQLYRRKEITDMEARDWRHYLKSSKIINIFLK